MRIDNKSETHKFFDNDGNELQFTLHKFSVITEELLTIGDIGIDCVIIWRGVPDRAPVEFRVNNNSGISKPGVLIKHFDSIKK